MSFRILFITLDDPFYIRLFFEEFFRTCEKLNQIVAVVICDAMYKNSSVKLIRQMYNFYGPLNFLRVGLRYAFYKLWANAPNFVKSNGSYSMKQLCNRYGITVIKERNINSRPFLEMLEDYNIDLITASCRDTGECCQIFGRCITMKKISE
jgi:methionyl-tRNA formyltransferase